MHSPCSFGRSPLAFFLLTFALAIPFWLMGPSGDSLSTGLLSVLPPFLPASALQAVCPLLAALLLVGMQDGLKGIHTFVLRVLDPTSVRWKRWLVPVVILPPIAFGLSYWIMYLRGTLLPEHKVSFTSVPVLLAVYFVAAVFEEGGWTGYATNPLQERWNALNASLLLVLVWNPRTWGRVTRRSSPSVSELLVV